MAVSQQTKPIVKLGAQGDSLAGSQQILFVTWVAPAAAGGERFHLTDTDGDTIVDDYAQGANYVQTYAIYGSWVAPTATVMQTGYCLIQRGRRLPIFWNAQGT